MIRRPILGKVLQRTEPLLGRYTGRGIIGLLICALALVGCSSTGTELDQRTRRYLNVPISEEVNATTIQSAILRDLPLGSSVSQVYEYLDHHGIGKDTLSSYEQANKDAMIFARISDNPRWFNFPVVCRISYAITFGMERQAELRLKDVVVREWRTCL